MYIENKYVETGQQFDWENIKTCSYHRWKEDTRTDEMMMIYTTTNNNVNDMEPIKLLYAQKSLIGEFIETKKQHPEQLWQHPRTRTGQFSPTSACV